MAFKLVKACRVCQTIKKEGGEKSTLLKRIYGSTQWLPEGETMMAILRDYEGKFTYLSLFNHCKKHQAPSDSELAERRIQHLQKEIEVEKIRKSYSHADVRALILDAAGTKLEEGDTSLVKASSVTAAMKQQADIEEKSKDRQLDIIKMMAAFQSGALRLEEVDGLVTAGRIASGATIRPDEG